MKTPIILAIETSCDDTSAAIAHGTCILSNLTAGQKIHEQYGGVVPELASRAHEKNIIPVVDAAFKQAGVTAADIDAVAFTRGPGLIGSLLVGASFAKAFALVNKVPLIEVNHMQAHILAHFITEDATLQGQEHFFANKPRFPFLCLTVSGGHTQLIVVKDYFDFELIGQTLDDAAGEAFDKTAKLLGLPYPGGPLVDKYAAEGNPKRFDFARANMPGFDFSFSGLKTSVLYFLQKEKAKDEHFIANNLNDLCASIQAAIIDMLVKKVTQAVEQTGIKHIAIAGGVSANKGLRNALGALAEKRGWSVFIPPMPYCTDNAAMIAITGYQKYLINDFADKATVPVARWPII